MINCVVQFKNDCIYFFNRCWTIIQHSTLKKMSFKLNESESSKERPNLHKMQRIYSARRRQNASMMRKMQLELKKFRNEDVTSIFGGQEENETRKMQLAIKRHLYEDIKHEGAKRDEATTVLGVCAYGKLQGMSSFMDPQTLQRIKIESKDAYINDYIYCEPYPGHEARAIKCAGKSMDVKVLTPVTTDAKTVASFIKSCDRREGLGPQCRAVPFSDQEPLGPNLYGKVFVPAYDRDGHPLGIYCLYYKQCASTD